MPNDLVPNASTEPYAELRAAIDWCGWRIAQGLQESAASTVVALGTAVSDSAADSRASA